ncbi:RasGTPase-activating protein [Pelomyxa schiedti]|nr:RasGTPase-activating protein [Pelomyxa schiedti]
MRSSGGVADADTERRSWSPPVDLGAIQPLLPLPYIPVPSSPPPPPPRACSPSIATTKTAPPGGARSTPAQPPLDIPLPDRPPPLPPDQLVSCAIQKSPAATSPTPAQTQIATRRAASESLRPRSTAPQPPIMTLPGQTTPKTFPALFPPHPPLSPRSPTLDPQSIPLPPAPQSPAPMPLGPSNRDHLINLLPEVGNATPPHIITTENQRCDGKLSSTPSSLLTTVGRLFENPYSHGLLSLKIDRPIGLQFRGAKPRAYCIISVPPEVIPSQKKLRTRTTHEKEFPSWGEEFSFDVPPRNSSPSLRVTVMSHSVLKSDDVIGWVDLSLNDIQRYKTQKLQMPLYTTGQADGDLVLQYTFLSVEDRNMYFTVAKTYFNELLSILTYPGFIVMSSILSGLKFEDTPFVVTVRLLSNSPTIHELIVHLLSEDVEAAESEGDNTLFRVSTAGTKLIAHYMKMIGYDYLLTTFQPFIKELGENSDMYEVDPEKAMEDSNLQENSNRLGLLIFRMVNAVCHTLEKIPMNIKLILYQVKCVVERKGHAPSLVVVALFFLRFIVPSLCNPESYHLIESDFEPDSRRVLEIVGKVIQYIVNLKSSTIKLGDLGITAAEPYIPHLKSLLQEFTNSLLQEPQMGVQDQPRSQLTRQDHFKLLAVLIQKIQQHKSEILDTFNWYSKGMPLEKKAQIEGHLRTVFQMVEDGNLLTERS